LFFLFPIKHTLCASFLQPFYHPWDNYLILIPKVGLSYIYDIKY